MSPSLKFNWSTCLVSPEMYPRLKFIKYKGIKATDVEVPEPVEGITEKKTLEDMKGMLRVYTLHRQYFSFASKLIISRLGAFKTMCLKVK